MKNQIPKNWEIVKIGSIANVTKLAGFEFTQHIKYSDEGTIIALRALNLKNGMLDLSDVKKIDKSTSDQLIRSKLFSGDVLLSYTGTIGNYAIIKENNKYHLAPNVSRIRTNARCLPEFMYHYLRTRTFKYALAGHSHGSSQSTVPMKNIREILITLPPINEQEQIVSILSVFDDKSEVNNKIAKNLEKMAQTIFKEWFVKSNIPAGKLSDIAEITMGQSPPSSFYNSVGDGMPFHQGVTNFGNRFPRHEIFCTLNNRLAQEGDLLFSVRAPVGRINIADTKISLGRGVASIRHRKGYQSYLYYFLKRLFKKEDSLGGGSVFPSVTKDDMEGMKIIIPDDQVVEKFESIVNDMDKKINLVERENQKLATLRDLLLPKLMKGEIIV